MIERKLSLTQRISLISVVLSLLAAATGCGSHPVTGTTIVGQIKVTADNSAITAGTSTQLHAVNTNSAGATNDVTSLVSWTSSSPLVAAVSASGVMTGLNAGTTMVTASLNGVSGSLGASIGAPAVTGLVLQPATTAVFTSAKQQYTAVATYANNTTGDATATAQFSVTPATVASIDANGVLTGMGPGTFAVTTKIGNWTSVATGTVVNAPLNTITVTPNVANIKGAGGTQQFTAMGTYADGTTKDVTKSVTWSTSDATLLTVNANGLGTATGNTTTHSVTVTATAVVTGGTLSAQANAQIGVGATLTQLVVTPTSSSIANGTAEPHLATATYSDGSTADVTGSVTWSVVPGSSSSVGHSSDVNVLGHAQGRAVHGQGLQSEATATAMDTATVVTVDQTGTDWAMAPGITTVQASMGALQSQSVVIVTNATVKSLAITTSKTFFPAGSVQPLQLIGRFSDGTTQDLSLTANWVSADPTVATIDSKGNVTGVKAGKTQMNASFGGLSATSGDLTVLAPNLLYVTVKAYTLASPVGLSEPLQLSGTYSDGTVQDLTSLATWASANPNVISVDSSGVVHPVATGLTEVTGTALGRTATLSLSVPAVSLLALDPEPDTPTFALGTTDAFSLEASYTDMVQADAYNSAVWTSSDPTVLTINSQGVAKAGKIGTATVTASLEGLTQTSFPVQVTAAQLWKLLVSPNTVQIAAQTGTQYSAVGFFTNGTAQDITQDAIWSTLDTTVARIDANGLLYGVKAGTTEVVCAFEGVTVHYPITVTSATLQSVSVTPANTELPIGVQKQFALMGTFSDGTVQDLSQGAVWSSSTPAIVDVLGQGIVLGTDIAVGSVAASYGLLSASTSVNVTNVSLTSLSLIPQNTTTRIGLAQPLTLTATFSDGSSQVIALGDAFVSSALGVAQVLNSNDTAYAVGVGTTTITASFQGKTATTNSFKVLTNVVSSLALTPKNPTMTVGGTLQLEAIATYADGSTGYVSRSSVWTSSNPAGLDVDNNAFATAKLAGVYTVTASSGGATSSFTVTVNPAGLTPVTLSSVAVTPANGSFAVNATQQFVMTATYSDGSTQDVTLSTVWTSSSPTVATISTTGLATGITAGSTQITGSFMGHPASTTSTVVAYAATLTSVLVLPTSSSIATGSAEQHTATAFYSDGSQTDVTKQVTWSVIPAATGSVGVGGLHAEGLTALDGSNTVAAVTPTGVDTAMTPGVATLQATLGSMTSQSAVVVTSATVKSLAIRASRDLFPVGSTQPIQLVGTFSDGTMQDLSLTANWVSSDPTIATIDQTGMATGVAAGNVVFTGSFGGLTASTIGYQVLPVGVVQLVISIDRPVIAVGVSQTMHVLGVYSNGITHDLTSLATWQSTNTSVYPVDSTGTGYGLAPGSAQVIATVGNLSAIGNVTAVALTVNSIDVLPVKTFFAQGTTQQFTALGHYSNGAVRDISTFSVWRSEDPTVLTIDPFGRAKAGRVGTTRVTVTRLGVTQESTDVTVTAATVTSLQITQTTGQLAALTGQHYKAYGVFSDGSFQDVTLDVLWNTSDNTIASIDTTGYGIGMRAGQVQITAALGGQTASTPLTVTAATLTTTFLTPGGDKVPKGVTRQYSLMGVFSDGTQQDLTQDAVWIAPTPTIVNISLKGQVLGQSVGIGEATAQYGFFSASTPVTVTGSTLVSSVMTPANATVRQGALTQFVNTGTFSDGQVVNLALGTVFGTATPAEAEILPTGLTYARGVGTTQMSSVYQGVTATTPFTVNSGTLTSLAVSPANVSLLVGLKQQFTATGTYTDGTTGDVTAATTWTSSNPLIFSIDKNGLGTALSLLGLAGRNGGLTALGTTNSANPATVPVTATSGGQSKNFNVTVLPSLATLTSVAVSPSSASFAKGTTQQFTLTGTYSDGSTQDLTSSATWTTSNAAVATISSNGLATGAGIGAVQITGSYNGKSSSTGTVNVTAATLASISVSPSSPSFAKGTTQQFTVTGTYTDGTTQDLTGSSTYTSSNPNVVSVSSGGLATGTGTGSAQVTITSGGQTVTTGTVQVTPATLTSIVVNPTSAHAAAGTTVQLTVTGTYTDGSTGDVTSSASWTTSAPSTATVSSTGLVTGVTAGLASITAQVGTLTNTGVVRVGAATLTSVAISPSGASFAAGATQKFTLTGTFSDGSTQDLSSSATWTTSDATVATVSSTGLATGVAPGSVQFTASYNGMTATTPTVSVQPATLVSIAVTPSSPSFAKGTTQQFTVIGTYSDGSTRDLTSTATFTSTNPSVVSISNGGLGQGLSTGSVQISVSAGGQTTSTQTVTVTPATLTSIVITPNNPNLAAGTSQQFTATGTFSDGTTQDLSGQVVWTSSNPQVMTIGQLGLASTFQTGNVQVSATLNGTTATTALISVSPATLASISLNPTTAQIAKGTVRQFTATGMYTDGSTQNVSSMVTWTTSNGSVASIDGNGLATGTGIGSATLTATLQGKTVSTNSFTVTAATLVSIAFTPANPTVATGSSSQVDVIGTYSDGSTQDLTSTAMYSSSNTNVATVGSTGSITGVAPGTSTVTVTSNGVTNSFSVTVSSATLVSIAITPANPAAFAKGTQQQFRAIGTYSDGTTQDLSTSATWTSSNPSVFTIDRNGLATGTGVGSGQLTAAYQGQTAMTGTVQVSAATVSSLAITPGNASFAVGSTQQYTATATYSDNTTADVSSSATWSSSNTGVLSINSTGFATGMGAGSAMVQAQYMGLAGSVNVTVTQAAATLQQIIVSAPSGSSATAGGTRQYTATAVYSNNSTMDVTSQAVWTSTNTAVATVNSTGLTNLVAAGTTSIQAQFGGVTGSANLTVTSVAPTLQSIAISPSSASVAKGLTQQFTATGTYSDSSTQNLTTLVTWMSSNTAYATINASGLATSTNGGQTQISASYQGKTAQVMLTVSAATLTSISLTPSSVNLANGTKQQIIATGTLSDGSTEDLTTSVTWSSSNTSNATVNASGLVSTAGVGQVTITAQAGSISATASVNVTAATPTSIQLTPTSVTVPVGGVQQMQATAMFTDGTSQDVTNSVTYTTSNPNVVTVDANGKLHGVGTGSATVTATLGSASTTASVSITQVALNSLAITPANVSLADGLSQQLTATGTFADGSTQNLTNTVTWSSSNPQVASVSSTGKVSVIGIGTVTITAATDNISATDQVTGTAAVVNAISVTPTTTTLAAGQTQQFAATATFTDGSQQTVTSSANWSVSDPTKGSISNSGSTKGFLTTTAAGTLNVVATINSVTGSVPVTVQAAALTVLRITPSPVSAPAGTTQQLTVTGSYTDGSTQNVTASTTWATNSASVATVDTNGLLHAIMPGSTSVQATVQSVSATDNVTTTAAVLNSIAITPSATSIAKGLTQQLTAIGTYTDGSTANITSQVQWSSSSPSVATVSGTGLVSTLATGTSTLTATLNSVSQTAALTVTAATLQSIAVTASQNSFALGLSLQLTATGTYTDGTTQNLTNSVTWTSSAPTVGMVSSTGLASGMTTGAFTARATMNGVTGSLPLTVTAAVLQSIVVTPANQIIVNVLGTTQFTATGHFSDGTTQNITNSVHWALSGPVNVGTISQTGQLSGVNVGVAGTVTATQGTIVGSTGFTVVGL